jgi:hypothetical protein
VVTGILPAPPPIAFQAMLESDLHRVPLIRLLVALRSLPRRLTRGELRRRDGDRRRAAIARRLADLRSAGWTVLAEEPGEALELGTVTRPWAPDLLPVVAPAFDGLDEFLAFDRSGFTKVALGVRVDPYERGACLATAHLRVASTDEASRRRFRSYWRFAQLFDELICRLALRRVARELGGARRRR